MGDFGAAPKALVILPVVVGWMGGCPIAPPPVGLGHLWVCQRSGLVGPSNYPPPRPGSTEGQNEQWREANRRRQRQTIRYRGLVPPPPPSVVKNPGLSPRCTQLCVHLLVKDAHGNVTEELYVLTFVALRPCACVVRAFSICSPQPGVPGPRVCFAPRPIPG